MCNKYTVATLCLTYNQSLFIEDTLKGFAIQETTFPVVYLIIDDASTDGEPDVLRRWARNNLDYRNKESLWVEMPYGELAFSSLKGKPQLSFVIILLSENHYGKRSKLPYITDWYENAKYIALCEGDDYWITAQKLQVQTDFLETNPEFGLCCTEVGIKNEKTGKLTFTTNNKHSEVIDFWQLLKKNRVTTPSVVLRKVLLDKYNKEVNPAKKKWIMADYPIWIWFGKESKIIKFNMITTVYRIAKGSISHKTDNIVQLDYLKSSLDIKTFFMEYYNIPPNNRMELIRDNANTIFKNALLKKNRFIYEYGVNYKKENRVKITLSDRVCGLLLSNKIGLKIVEYFLRTRIDNF